MTSTVFELPSLYSRLFARDDEYRACIPIAVIPDLYGCLPDSKKNLSYVVKKSAA